MSMRLRNSRNNSSSMLCKIYPRIIINLVVTPYRFLYSAGTQFFRRFHAAYVDAVSNPFHVPGKKIASRIFAGRVSGIVKTFALGTNG